MANLNKVMLIGRLTRDPEVRTFSTGGKVAKFGFAVNNRRFNKQTNDWEDEPVFIDVDVFNRGETGKLADRVEQNLRKGQQIFIEGHLRLDQWTSQQDNQKRSKITVVCDNFLFLDARPDGSGGVAGGMGEGGSRPMGRPTQSGPRVANPSVNRQPVYEGEPEPQGGGMDEEIPF